MTNSSARHFLSTLIQPLKVSQPFFCSPRQSHRDFLFLVERLMDLHSTYFYWPLEQCIVLPNGSKG